MSNGKLLGSQFAGCLKAPLNCRRMVPISHSGPAGSVKLIRFPHRSPRRKFDHGYQALFNGMNLDNWIGTPRIIVRDGVIDVDPSGGEGNLTRSILSVTFLCALNFNLHQEPITGLAFHTPLTGDAAYVGKEIQVPIIRTPYTINPTLPISW